MTVAGDNGYAHAYLITSEDAHITYAANKLFDTAKPRLPIILQTDISKDAGGVREIFCRFDPRIEETIKTAGRFHLSIIVLQEGSPDNELLLREH